MGKIVAFQDARWLTGSAAMAQMIVEKIKY